MKVYTCETKIELAAALPTTYMPKPLMNNFLKLPFIIYLLVSFGNGMLRDRAVSYKGLFLIHCMLLEGECVNQEAKPNKPSSTVGVQNDIRMGFGSVLLRLEGVR